MYKYTFIFAGLLFNQFINAQALKIGTIEVFGNRKTNAAVILKNVNVKIGDSIRRGDLKSDEVTATLKKLPGVKHATISTICCNPDGGLMLFIGIGETDASVIPHRNPPVNDLLLPDSVMNTWQHFLDELGTGTRQGDNGENDSLGYALFNYPPARTEQLKLISFAANNFIMLAEVLKKSKYGKHRAAAAFIIAYTTEKKQIVEPLLYAVDDTDEEVRNNATRALSVLAGYIQSHAELEIKIPADPFIKMLNSVVWTDRNKGASVLFQLTANRNPEVLLKIKQQALPAVIEMAKWKSRGHAFFSFALLGRIKGASEETLAENNFSTNYQVFLEDMLNL